MLTIEDTTDPNIVVDPIQSTYTGSNRNVMEVVMLTIDHNYTLFISVVENHFKIEVSKSKNFSTSNLCNILISFPARWRTHTLTTLSYTQCHAPVHTHTHTHNHKYISAHAHARACMHTLIHTHTKTHTYYHNKLQPRCSSLEPQVRLQVCLESDITFNI